MAQSPGEELTVNQVETYFHSWEALSRLLFEGGSLSGRERHCCFLNTGKPGFADISAVSGLDLLDDGRGLAVVDWDHDGDLDFWISNRNGPRVRFLRNDVDTDNHFLSVKLVGTTCNRDAIGARLELTLAGTPTRTLIKTLRAGEGYLSQSSKWVHFGLGEESTIGRLVVRWPGDEAEEYTNLTADRQYEIFQGRGAKLWKTSPRNVHLDASNLKAPPATSQARIVLTRRETMPAITYRDFEQRSHTLDKYRGRPFLINLWATWCAPCVAELNDFSEHAEQLQSSGLEIVALNFDSLGDNPDADPKQAAKLLQQLKFPFDGAVGTPQVAEKLESGLFYYFDRADPLSLPTSFLVDSSFRVAVIYVGPVSAEQLLNDMKLLEASPEELEKAALPFPGRWMSAEKHEPPADHWEFSYSISVIVLVLVFSLICVICLKKMRA